jgi:hypothetical protein
VLAHIQEGNYPPYQTGPRWVDQKHNWRKCHLLLPFLLGFLPYAAWGNKLFDFAPLQVDTALVERKRVVEDPPWPCIYLSNSCIAKFWLVMLLMLAAMVAISLVSWAANLLPPRLWWWWGRRRTAGASLSASLVRLGGASSSELISLDIWNL